MEVYRITHKKWSGHLSASGFPARWNSAGAYVSYSAGSRSLACLENVVHKGTTDLKRPYISMTISIPDDIEIKIISIKELPSGWHHSGETGYQLCRSIGDTWVRNSETAVLKVPSAIVENDSNYLINPGHPDFLKIKIIAEEPFAFDRRIKKEK